MWAGECRYPSGLRWTEPEACIFRSPAFLTVDGTPPLTCLQWLKALSLEPTFQPAELPVPSVGLEHERSGIPAAMVKAKAKAKAWNNMHSKNKPRFPNAGGAVTQCQPVCDIHSAWLVSEATQHLTQPDDHLQQCAFTHRVLRTLAALQRPYKDLTIYQSEQ